MPPGGAMNQWWLGQVNKNQKKRNVSYSHVKEDSQEKGETETELLSRKCQSCHKGLTFSNFLKVMNSNVMISSNVSTDLIWVKRPSLVN